MKPTSGRLAVLAAWTAGFGLTPSHIEAAHHARDWHTGHTLTLPHRDGRVLTLELGPGNGWQHGELTSATGSGVGWATTDLTAKTVEDMRHMLKANDPDGDQPYCGGEPIPQARALTGRERDILTRIFQDLIRANQERPDELAALVHLEDNDVQRLVELRAVLDPRDD